MENQFWYQKAVFYEVYVRAFYDANGDGHGDLIGLTQKLDYLKLLGVNCIWLLPIYPSPLKDDGYDVADYCNIHPDYGNLEDFKALVVAAHELNLKIILDLVMNHTSDQHPWFKAARANRTSKYHDYYVWSETDKKYSDARIIFLDTEKSNWTWNEATQEYYWHRFYSSQPDLNYENPVVIQEMYKIAQFWLELGIDGFRIDAVPYLIEREGTNCENLPETHQILKDMRRFVDAHYPGKLLLCEANQWPKDVRKYLGDGDEFQLAFNFPIMPRLFMALKQANSAPIKWAIDQLPTIPENCQWGIFLRNHDELTLEMVSEEERQYMWQQYSPDKRYRLNLGIRRRLAALLDNDRRKIELANSLLFSLPGSPFLYYGDEIGMGDDVTLFDRNGLRTPMQWDAGKLGGFSQSEKTYASVLSDDIYGVENVNVTAQVDAPDSLWHIIKKMIALRSENPILFSHGLRWVECSSSSIVAYERGSGEKKILAVHNLSDKPIFINLILSEIRTCMLIDLFTSRTLNIEDNHLELNLTPYQYLWLKESTI